MLRDNLVGLIEPMLSSAGANPLALCTARKKPSDDRPPCLGNPRPAGAESTLTENAASPFHAEPKQSNLRCRRSRTEHLLVEKHHASTSPASCMPCARPQAKRCSTTKALPNHSASGWTCSSIHSLPWEVRGRKGKTVPSLRTRTSGVIGTGEEILIMRAPL